MTEPMTAESAPAAAAPTRRTSRMKLLLRGLVLLAVLGSLGYGGWRLWQMRADQLETLEQQDALLRRINRQLGLQQSQVDALEGRLADVAQSARNNTDEIGGAQGRLDGVEQSLQHLQSAVEGGSTRMQLLAVQQLLLIANDRAQLASDARTAAAALALAQERLGELADPRLLEIRKAIADERAALSAVPSIDVQGTALSLGALIERTAQLPLRVQVPDEFAPHPQAAAPAPETAGSWRARLAQRLHDVLTTLFTVRRTDRPLDPLLAPEQEHLVGAVFVLKLETARAALLDGDPQVYNDALQSAVRWLAHYYRKDDPSVEAVQAELERLQALQIRPPLPDLSRSLSLLRAWLEATPR